MPPLVGPFVDTSVPSSTYFGSQPGAPGTTPASTPPNQYSPGAIFRGMTISIPPGVTSIDVWAVPFVLFASLAGGSTVGVWQDNVFKQTLTFGGAAGVKAKQSIALDGNAHTLVLEEQAVVTNVVVTATQRPVTFVASAAPQVGVLYHGDSVVRGVNAAPFSSSHFALTRHALPSNYGCTNWGVPGKVMGGTGNDFPTDLARCFGTVKNIVVNTLGVNDYNAGGTLAGFISSYQTWITGMKANLAGVPGLKLLLVTLPNSLFTPVGGASPGGANLNGATLLDFVNAVRNLATSNSVDLLDLYALPVYPISSIPSIYTSDGVHPENAGMVNYSAANVSKILTM